MHVLFHIAKENLMQRISEALVFSHCYCCTGGKKKKKREWRHAEVKDRRGWMWGRQRGRCRGGERGVIMLTELKCGQHFCCVTVQLYFFFYYFLVAVNGLEHNNALTKGLSIGVNLLLTAFILLKIVFLCRYNQIHLLKHWTMLFRYLGYTLH